MVERTILFTLVPLAVMLGSIGHVAAASYRLRDWRPALFIVVLGLMSVHQANELLVFLDPEATSAVAGVGEYPETLANLTASAGVVLILRLVARQQTLSGRLEDQIERQRRLRLENERLDRFASVIAHDVRNPLQVAKGRVGVARADGGNDEDLAAAAESLDRIETLIEETLELARNGQVVTDPEIVSIDGLVADSREMVGLDETAVTVVDGFDVAGDPDRLQQLLENLLQNAVDHGAADDLQSDGGRPPVTVRVGRLDDGFYVEDTGPGIPEADRETVLEPGYTTESDGTGFGLAIVDEIAEAHGWAVAVRDGTEGGARFEFHGAEVRA